MKVYVIEYSAPYEGSLVLGVALTEEKAKELVDEYLKRPYVYSGNVDYSEWETDVLQ